jgi:hypothetical protein
VSFRGASSPGITIANVSDAARVPDGDARGVSLLPRDLTHAQLTGASTLASVDLLLIDDLSDAEDDAFAAAISS